LCTYFAPEGAGVDEVDESALPVDLDHGQPLSVLRLELVVAADVDLLELEGQLGPDLLDDAAGLLAEVAALRVVQSDPTDRSRA
jgi:hypothetical protein